MAEIVEVIHRINYEVNDSDLQRASGEFARQLNAIVKLQNQLVSLQKDLKETANGQSAEFDKISRNIARVTQLLEKEAAKTKSFLGKYGVDIVKGLGLDTKIGNAIASWVKPAEKQLRSLAATGASLGGTLAAAAGKLSPLGNIISTAIPIVMDLAGSFFDAEEGVDKFTDAIDEVEESRRKIAGYAADEMANLFTLRSKIEDVNLAYGNRLEAVRQLKEQNPGFFEHLKQEELLAGKVGDAYERVVKNILLKAQSNVLKDMLEKQLTGLLASKQKLEERAKKEGVSFEHTKTVLPGFDRLDHTAADKVLFSTVDPKNSTAADASGHPNYIGAPMRQLNLPKGPSGQLTRFLTEYNSLLEPIEELMRSILEIERQLATLVPASGISTSSVRKANNLKKGSQVEKMDVRQTPLQSLPGEPGVPQKAEMPAPETNKPGWERKLFGDTADIENPEERRRAEIKKSIDAYQTLANAAVQAFQTIYDAQIKALDAEIAIRQKRVEAATKLAEKGNTDALKIEQERLDKAQKQREDFARRQQVINAALAVSNAVLAVAQAAGETGPGAIAVVPAVIAAIVAGYAAISAATRESTAQAFADGVVGFRGKGGPRDDKNWVRISSGESVITAKGTAANRSILEAINKGAEFRMLDAQKLGLMPVATGVQGGFASKQSLKGLEKKLDGVIDAVKDNQFKQDVFFNEHGVGLITQRAIRRDSNRFK